MQLEGGARKALGKRIRNHEMRPEGNQLILLPEAHGELPAKVYANVNVSGGFAAHRMCRHGDAGLSSQILVVRVCSDPMSRKKSV